MCPARPAYALEAGGRRGRCCVQAYVAGYASPAANVEVLEELLAVRHQIAALHEEPSWAHYQVPCRGTATCPSKPIAVQI